MLGLTTERIIGKIIPFGIIWMAFGILYTLIERGLLGDLTIYPATGNPYSFKLSFIVVATASFFMGLLLGTIETVYLSKIFSNRSFGFKIFIKNLIYVLAICIFLLFVTFMGNSQIMDLPLFHPKVISSVFNFLFTSFVFWSIVLYIGAIIAITLFVSEISDNVGQGVLLNFLTGKYHKPRVEERIFMFLDMRSSTSIAEKLGHVTYYEFLNKYYEDLSEAIVKASGKIYQYVGDEVIVRWPISTGLENSNYLQCFFMIRKILNDKTPEYQDKYGIIPAFKAGFHYGKVTMGEIGVLKKEIIFTGDVLNTTSRIQGLCNDYNVDILVSEQLFQLHGQNDDFEWKEIGVCELKGRDEKIKLLTVSPQKSIT